jgi:two-component system, NarL family, invasion response regulator UvrY
VRDRVLVVDDSEVFLRAAASVISATDSLRLVGSAMSGEEGVRLLPQLEPDLVLLDIQLPGIDGIDTARRIREQSPGTVVILISAEPEGFEASGLAAGAVSLLDKRDFNASTLEALWSEHRPATG